MNNSDLQLQEANQKLKESKQKLVQAIQLERRIEEKDNAIKINYDKCIQNITTREVDVIKRENQAEYLIKKQEIKINEKAMELTSDTRKMMELEHRNKENELKNLYELKEYQLYALTFGGLLYGFFVTVLTIMMTERFKKDFKALIEFICHTCLLIWDNVLVWANEVSDICNKIPNEIVAVVLGWIVKVLFIVLIVTFIIGVIGWIIYKLVEFYKLGFADRISAVVSLISFALLIWFGDYIGSVIKWNLVLIFIVIQCIYLGIRTYSKKPYN
ncbi:DUF6040 family protein [Acetoanaerobium sticklandii]|uniref:DUF6040 family protein n=1 Tax=Acetoanaerobium sticklandii TaxID=1511 RepID=UPI003A9063CB